MNHGSDLVLNLDSLQKDYIVHTSNKVESKKAKPAILYLGDRNLKYIKEFENKGYTLIQTLKAKALHSFCLLYTSDAADE